jgi:Nitrile hydratase beta subunit
MNGIHDCGGRDGFGPIDIDPEQPVFHADWERRMFGMFILAFGGGHFNIDQFRSAIEQMRPAEYLESTYYEHWLHALEALCVENGTLTRKELDDRLAALSKGMH